MPKKLATYGLDGKLMTPTGPQIDNAKVLGDAMQGAKGLQGKAHIDALSQGILKGFKPVLGGKARRLLKLDDEVITEPQSAFHARMRKLGVAP